MTPIYLDTPASNSFALASDHQEHHDHQLKLFIAPSYHQIDHDQSSSNPFHHDPHSHQHGYDNLVYNNVWHDETSDHQVSPSSSNHPIISDNSKSSIITSSIIRDNNDTNKSSNGLTVKWVSSKMRMMRKMMNNSNCAASTKYGSDEQQKHHDHDHQRQLRTNPSTQINYFENGNNDFIRACSNCNTTKTPLWRGGPCGPKSLCNACGIRQRKARRAMEAAAAATNGTVLDTTTDTSSSSSTKTSYKVIKKEKKLHKNQYKKKCKLDIDHDIQQVMICDNNEYHESTDNNKKTCFEEFALNLLSKNSGFRGVFPQDEEEGAILLMALSCGLA